jgi:hypothetical protein
VADAFIRVTLKDGSTHTVDVPDDATPHGLIELAAKGQRWPESSGWIEVEGGGSVTRRLVATSQIVAIELFER